MTVFRAFASTPPGVEPITARELRALRLDPTVAQGGVAFETEGDGLCAAHLHLRTAGRILVRVAAFEARGFPTLEKQVSRLPWDMFSRTGDPIEVRVTTRKSRLYHQGAVAERVGRGALAAGRTLAAAEASAETSAAADLSQTLYVRIVRDRCTVSVDATGPHLHRRGYRLGGAKAPLRETLAAAALLAVPWDARTALVDPLCGSGTLPIEAALIARAIAPGLNRRFASEAWPALDPGTWERARERARAGAHAEPSGPPAIAGSDRDEGAVRAARENAARAGVERDVEWSCRPLSAATRPGVDAPGLLLANPPYGRRIGQRSDLRGLYAALGHLARREFAGWTIAILGNERRLVGQIGVPMEPCLSTRHGGISIGVWRGRVPAD